MADRHLFKVVTDITHVHPLFLQFKEYEGDTVAGFEPSYFGAKFRDWILSGAPQGLPLGTRIHVGYPPVSEEYFEWIALMGAVISAQDHFCMFELGAGWGRWSIYAAMLCRQRGHPFTLVAVEPEPTHFKWLHMVFQDNGLNLREHHLYEAAVVPASRAVRLAGVADPIHEYGHYVSVGLAGRLRSLRAKHAIQPVKAVTLRELLKAHPKIDLIDMDIQGMEDKVIRSVTAEELDHVRIIHIGTHSRRIEARLKQKFARLGWRNAFSFPCDSKTLTAFGPVKFEDGVETWVHPREEPLLKLLTS